ncbi:MAG: Flp pilus assembly complex ATPase component TadA, partial [Phycisphaerales bacterium]|nr:Flp pilus assembly complex ATPase component TadA [Phycisphaerales bacterium]
LRQDPDVVLLGEIRDSETGMIATQASLTGHLVLSTLHTNDAAGAVTRLRDLGVPPFVINASLLGVLAQRLVRRICVNCVSEYEPESFLLRRFGERAGTKYRRGTGCSRCGGTGFRGRVGVYEYLRISPVIAAAIDNDATTRELHETALDEGMHPMWRDGLHKARTGQTTLEEVARTVALAEQDDAPETLPTEEAAGNQTVETSEGMRLSA